MSHSVNLIVFPVRDVARARRLYTTLLGVEPYTEAAYYVGFRVGDREIGLVPNGHATGLTGPLAYVDVDDIHAHLRALVEAGAEEQQGVTNVGGGLLIARVRDADGNLVGLRQAPAQAG